MKKLALAALILSMLTLTGCTNKTEAEFIAFSESLEGKHVSVNALVHAEYEDISAEFTITCTEDDTGCTVTVTEPEEIRGVQARLESGSTSLMYNGIVLDTGGDGGTGISPMNALPMVVEALRSGYVDSCARDGEERTVWLSFGDGCTAAVSFDADMMPVHAELAAGERTVIYCDIAQFAAE